MIPSMSLCNSTKKMSKLSSNHSTSNSPPSFRVRVYHPFNFFLFLFLSIPFTPTSSLQIIPSHQAPSKISYSQHCGQILPEPITTGTPLFNIAQFPSFYNAHVVNGGQIIGPSSQITANFIPRNVFKTVSDGIFRVESSLVIRVNWSKYRKQRNLLNVYGGPRFPVTPRILRFQISGFWNSASGQLCMVGLGSKRTSIGKSLQFDVAFKAIYPNSAVITSSLVTGTLESLNFEGSESYFQPILITGFARVNYEYTLIKDEIQGGFENVSNDSLMHVGGRLRSCYPFISVSDNFELEYRSSCGGRNCSKLDGILGFLPKFMSLNEIDCSNERIVRVVFGFSNTSDIRHGYRQPFDLSRTLVAEGGWSAGKNKLFYVACRIFNSTGSPMDASVGDCSIRVNLSFPDSLNIRTRSVITGHIWSNKSVNEPGYFDSTEIRAYGSKRASLPDIKYQYTEIETAKNYCSEKKGTMHKGKSYPDPYSQDMKFDMDVKNSKGQRAWGKAHPIFVGDRYVQHIYPYFRSSVVPIANSAMQVDRNRNGLLNLTYQLTFSPKDEFKVGGRSFLNNETIPISAEGIYSTETGRLCMVGCWDRDTDGNVPHNTSGLDCGIFIDIQFPPRNSTGGDVVKGTIESKREKSDSLYFEHLGLSATSLTKSQVDNVFWRMDFEITMVLISNTLACISVGLQLLHVKRHPDVLPFISVVMLAVITLGHMIPLLLNMEAFFLSSPSKRTVLFGSGGWLEVNEVLVRVITMIAFLLEFRLLQLKWSAKGDDGSQITLWASEKKAIYYSLPLYLAGALIAWSMQRSRGSQKTPFRTLNLRSNPTFPFWNDVKSYAGFILDVFLLPQLMFNIFSDSKGNALSLPYYVGTTIVRLLPHGYDLFRAHSSAWKFDPWYIYANPGMNYYSTAWDIIICCAGLFFVVIIYLQQRCGGRWVLPRRFRESASYEKVPVGL